MSGGSLGYFYVDIQGHVGDFEDKELDELVKDIAELFHDREWFLSGDTGEGDWNEARDAFKAKWFTPTGRADRIEKYLAEIGQEVRGMFGLGEYCQDCEHWKKEANCEHYGRCKYVKGCLVHRSDNKCKEFAKGTEQEIPAPPQKKPLCDDCKHAIDGVVDDFAAVFCAARCGYFGQVTECKDYAPKEVSDND